MPSNQPPTDVYLAVSGSKAIAGPMHVVAVRFQRPVTDQIFRIYRKLSWRRLCSTLLEMPLQESVKLIDVETINQQGIQGSLLAVNNLLTQWSLTYGVYDFRVVITDPAIPQPADFPIDRQVRSLESLAANAIAYIHQQQWFETYHDAYPEYNWVQNHGWGWGGHCLAILKHGITPHHRFNTAKTVARWLVRQFDRPELPDFDLVNLAEEYLVQGKWDKRFNVSFMIASGLKLEAYTRLLTKLGLGSPPVADFLEPPPASLWNSVI